MSGRRRDSGGGHEGGDERWLLTYADMITLLLALFIVLFAMSTIDAKKFENVKHSLSETFKGSVIEEPGHVLDGSTGAMDPENANNIPDKAVVTELIQATNATANRMQSEQQKLSSVAKATKLGAKNVEVTQAPNGSVVLRVAGDALFEPGSSEVRPEFRADLLKIERELTGFGAQISIGGHTDGQPIDIPGGNMALSQSRALAVLTLFKGAGYRGYVDLRAYADQVPVEKPRPGHEHDSIPKNRRIEITVLAPGADDPRPKTIKLIEQAKSMQQVENPAPLPIKPVAQTVQNEIDLGVAGDLAAQSREIG